VIVIVGHGPSILSGLGAVIDSCTVVRLKKGLPKKADPTHWGTRTDYLCGTHPAYEQGGIPYWHFPPKGGWADHWHEYWKSLKPGVPFKPWQPKPSTGLAAVFCAMEFLKPKELAFIGCDRLMSPEKYSGKWNETGPQCQPHDWHTERRALHGLGIKIIDLREHG
jgi:hypothetical protein